MFIIFYNKILTLDKFGEEEKFHMDDNRKIYDLLVKMDSGYTPTDKERFLLDNTEELNWGSYGIEHIPHSISRLKNLRQLIAWDNRITILPEEICSLTQMTDLILQGNLLESLPNSFSNLINLKVLFIGDNPWNTFPNQLRSLRKLKTLSLRGCNFQEIPEWILDFNLPFSFSDHDNGIILTDTNITTPKLSLFYQTRESIQKYYQRLRENSQIIRETKTIFLGDGGVGKTYTIDRIISREQQLKSGYKTDVTKGISITHKDFEVGNRVITIHFWDFGGQQIMHSMHRCFLTNNTIYVIVLSGRTEDMQRRLDYWMTGLNTFTDGNCPVIIFENCFSGKSTQSINAEQAKRRYPNIYRVLSFSSKDASDCEFKVLLDTIVQLAISKSRYGERMGKLWADIKTYLENSNAPYLTERQYISICSPEIDATERLNILTWFNDLGISFSYHTDKEHIVLHDYVVLNPEWATNAIYAIITNGQKWTQTGMLTYSQIENILKQTQLFVNTKRENVPLQYIGTEITYILALMEKFRISYATAKGKEFIPSLCPNNEPPNIDIFMRDCDLHYELQYSYLPINILHGLMIGLYPDLEAGENWWYSGAFFYSHAYRCQALIIQEESQNSDKISIYVKQEKTGEAWRYLQVIRQHLFKSGERLNISAEDYLIYREDCKEESISLNTILNSIKCGWSGHRSTLFQKEISYSDILKTVTTPDIANAIAKGGLLIDIIIAACLTMQKRAAWLPYEENPRNDYLCDILRSAGIFVLDQTHSGIANTKAGNLDFIIQDNNCRDYAIIEAMNLTNINKHYIQTHITKLMSLDRYNVNGLKELYLLAYVTISDFDNFANAYEKFLKTEALYLSAQQLKNLNSIDQAVNSIRVWQATHENDTIVYHICARIPKN